MGGVEERVRNIAEVSQPESKLYDVRPFHFMIVGLEEMAAEEGESLLSTVCETLQNEGANISTISSLVVTGYFDSQDATTEIRERVVHALLQDCGKKIRILHGHVNGIIGNLGSKHRYSYGPFISGFEEIREQLEKVPFGSASEFKGFAANEGRMK